VRRGLTRNRPVSPSPTRSPARQRSDGAREGPDLGPSFARMRRSERGGGQLEPRDSTVAAGAVGWADPQPSGVARSSGTQFVPSPARRASRSSDGTESDKAIAVPPRSTPRPPRRDHTGGSPGGGPARNPTRPRDSYRPGLATAPLVRGPGGRRRHAERSESPRSVDFLAQGRRDRYVKRVCRRGLGARALQLLGGRIAGGDGWPMPGRALREPGA
jgi:hypothetical protein